MYIFEVKGSYRNLENYSRLIGYGFGMTPEMAADQAYYCAARYVGDHTLGRQARIVIKWPVKNGEMVHTDVVE